MSDEPKYTVHKYGRRVPVSVELLLAYGEITEEQAREMGWTPPPPVPWRRRVRYVLSSWWFRHRPRVHFGPCPDSGDYL